MQKSHSPSKYNTIKQPSAAAFGKTFALVFAGIGVMLFLRDNSLYLMCACVSVSFLILAFVKPSVLHPLNKAWFKVGTQLHKVMTPLIMAIIFFGIFTPIAFLLKALKRDPLNRAYDQNKSSYWVARQQKITKTSLENQF